MNGREGLTIVVGYDGSDAARRALARVRDLEPRAARILLVTVAPELRSAGLQSDLAGGTFDAARVSEEAFDLLDAPKALVELRTTTGDPAVVLVEVAREVAANLLVVGRRGGDFVARTLLGSVAQRVVQQAPCDVLVVA